MIRFKALALTAFCALPSTAIADAFDVYTLCLLDQFNELVNSGEKDILTPTGFLSIERIEATLWASTPACLSEKNDAVAEHVAIFAATEGINGVDAEREVITGAIIDMTTEIHLFLSKHL